jgi:hypothetical protein
MVMRMINLRLEELITLEEKIELFEATFEWENSSSELNQLKEDLVSDAICKIINK